MCILVAVFVVNRLDSDVTFSHNRNDTHEIIWSCSLMVDQVCVIIDSRAFQVQSVAHCGQQC